MTNLPASLISLVAVLNENDDVLLLKRNADVHCPNLWSFPGGKAEAGEEPLQTAIRELQEETHIKGKLWRHMGKHAHTYSDKKLYFTFFFCRYNNAAILKTETTFQWCPLEQLKTLDMPDANAVLINMLMEFHQEGLLPR